MKTLLEKIIFFYYSMVWSSKLREIFSESMHLIGFVGSHRTSKFTGVSDEMSRTKTDSEQKGKRVGDETKKEDEEHGERTGRHGEHGIRL